MPVKSVATGVATLLLASSAFAADLPGAPGAVDYVRVCDAYGMGYFYVPGTETCLRLSGRVRADTYVWGNDKGYADGSGWGTRTTNGLSTEARGYLYMDARTNTEFGELRTYTEMYTTIASGDSGSQEVTLENAYVQFGGLTAGRGQSMYDFFTGYNFAIFDAAYSDTKTNMIAYTYGFSNGVSATLSLEDPTFRNLGVADNLYYGPYYAELGGVRTPDVVAAIRMEQDWGTAQLSGVLHNVYTNQQTVGSALGWAVLGGVELNVPQLGPSTTVALQGAGGQGALAYVSTGAYAPAVNFWSGVSENPGSAVDAVVDTFSGDLNLVSAWSVIAGITHAWTPTWSSNLTTSYLDAQVDGSAFSRLGDFQNVDVQANLVYTPVAGLDIGAEVDYKYVSRQYGSDLNGVVGTFRIERTF